MEKKIVNEKEDKLEDYIDEITKDHIETDLEKTWLKEISKYPLLTEEEEKECGRDLKNKEGLQILDKNNHINLQVVFANLENNPHTEEILQTLIKMYQELEEKSLDPEYSQVKKYLREFRRLGRPLTAEEMKKCFHMETPEAQIEEEELLEQVKKFKTYNLAKYKMIHSNLRLVVKPARRYAYKTNTEFLDLAAEGSFGLIKAADRYDVDKGFRFSTYATWWIRQSISRHVGEYTSSLNLSTSQYREVKNFKEAVKKLEEETGKKYSASELSVMFEIPYEEVVNVMYYNPFPISFDTPIGEEEDTTIGDMVPDEETDFDKNISNEEMRALLESSFSLLKPEQELVMRLLTGFNDEHREYSVLEVARTLKKTKARINAIQTSAYKRLRILLKRDNKFKQLINYIK